MDSSDAARSRPGELVEDGDHEAAVAALHGLRDASVEERKAALRSLEELATDASADLGPLVRPLTEYLRDEDRSVRLTTAKLFVALADETPDVVVPAVSTLVERLADDEEFYFVRARAAEALGFVARTRPEAAATRDVLADLRIGLDFDEPEVREKLAKALEHVALGDPSRLDHQVEALAEHLDDENVRVRYHLATTLVVVGAERPASLATGRDRLLALLDDENQYVRGRAAEALGLLARTDAVDAPVATEAIAALLDDEPFVAERARFALATTGRADASDVPAAVGTIDGVRERTDDVLAELTAPAAEGECPGCGLQLPESGPPLCPRCGAPR